MKAAGIILWISRLLGLFLFGFTSLVTIRSLEPGIPFQEQITPLLIHLIPALILAGILVYAWGRPLAGGIAFAITGVIFSTFFFIRDFQSEYTIWNSLLHILFLSFPLIITGFLFILSARLEKRKG